MHNSGNKMFGTFRADAELLKDVGVVRNFLLELCERIEMRELGTHLYDVPIAIKRLGGKIEHDEGGITAITILSTSHVAIHTWPEDDAARFDIDSCRGFDSADVVEVLQETFGAHSIQYEERLWRTFE